MPGVREWETLGKTCFNCGEFHRAEDFYAHPKMADGLLGKCKACIRDYAVRRYHATRDQRIAYEKVRHGPDRVAGIEASRARHPEHARARQAVKNALVRGKLVRLPCVRCGEVKSEAHHEDYGKPLEVMWLCRIHHGERHREINRQRRIDAGELA